MIRSRTTLALLLAPLAALIVVGCLYRGYFAGLLPSAAAELDELTLPPGFHIAVYAGNVPSARQMAVGPAGIVFVGSRSEGKVYAVVDRDGDHRADQVHVLASGLNMPSGVAFRDGALYVAAVNRVLRFPDVARDLARPPKPEVVSDAYPPNAHHGWKFIAFGPDGRLYVPVGAPCNVCAPPVPSTPRSRGSTSPVVGRKSWRGACGTASDSTSTRRRESSGSPTTVATGSATSSRRTS